MIGCRRLNNYYRMHSRQFFQMLISGCTSEGGQFVKPGQEIDGCKCVNGADPWNLIAPASDKYHCDHATWPIQQ